MIYSYLVESKTTVEPPTVFNVVVIMILLQNCLVELVEMDT